MLSHVHHINFAVDNLNASVEYFEKLFQQRPIIEELPLRQVITARFSIGESLIILVQPLTGNGAVAHILATKGEGVFLVSFATQSIDDTLRELDLRFAEKREGLEGWSICDIAPIEQFGAVLQLTELSNK